MNLVDIVKKQIELNPNLLYMEGTPEHPRSAASRRVVEALRQAGAPFSWVDVTANSEIARAVQQYSGMHGFPQLFVGGRFAGVARDIGRQLREGHLQQLMADAMRRVRIKPSAAPSTRFSDD